MTKITWLGDELIIEPPSIVWNGIKFVQGVPVEVTDAHMINKARSNQFFKVSEDIHETQEAKEEEQPQKYNYRTAKNKSGYTPVKKKADKEKRSGAREPDLAPRSDPDPLDVS